MAECGKLPVEDREDTRFGGVEDHVVATEIAVDDPRLVVRGDVVGQPRDQGVHVRIAAGIGIVLILFRPAGDLPREVISGPPVIVEADGGVIDTVQGRERRVHRVEIGGTLFPRHVRESRVPDDPPLNQPHHEERRADDAVVGADAVDRCDRHVGVRQRGEHARLAQHIVRALQQRPRRFAAQDISGTGRGQAIGGVGLPALELIHGQRPGKAIDMVGHPAGERGFVETVGVPDGGGARVGGLAERFGHSAVQTDARLAARASGAAPGASCAWAFGAVRASRRAIVSRPALWSRI
ncbi:hypothetical protein WR25_09599 [Diploscapter pachys]|uniref:Uncharacterized protein n=1 Tax=Diploscapter pachys TaxID=2018661 RepID=A0A2A2M3M2_9BILA|nr:hypothetical protein WR25_09599 [Diploscapter pachys]